MLLISRLKYTLEKPEQTTKQRGTNRLTVILCRLRGHSGTIYYNPGALEPDNRCKNCLEEIA